MELTICDYDWHQDCNRMINKSQDYVGVHQLLHILSTTHTQTTIVISHHMIAFCACRRNCLELVTCPVKTCSSDQTVTPLIREGSDWNALEGQKSYSGSNDYGIPKWQWRLYSLWHNWYVTSEDLTQWIDYLIELDSTFTWDVKLLLEWDSSSGFGSPWMSHWMRYTVLELDSNQPHWMWCLKLDFRRKEQLPKKWPY